MGQLLWAGAGVDLCTRPLNDDLFVVACANRGGAIIAWHDHRSGDYDIRAQSVNASGKVRWGADGVAVCIAAGDQTYPAITWDEDGGAFVAWQDYRRPPGGVFVQHVNEGGNPVWGASGLPTSMTAGSGFPAVAGDGRGGAFVSWTDSHGGVLNFDVVAERITDRGREGRRGDGRGWGRRPGRLAVGLVEGGEFSVRLSLPEPSNMRTEVFDLAGRKVRNLAQGFLESGEHTVRWDGRDDMGRRVGAGVYFVRIQTDHEQQTLRAVVAR